MKADSKTRNPFGVMDVPDPDGAEVAAHAVVAILKGASDDPNAHDWTKQRAAESIEGAWLCRWNGGADPTIPNDAKEKWKQGRAELRVYAGRVYALFDWDNGARRGLIDAKREGNRLVGKYINLTNPSVTRPWVGMIVADDRIDGQWTEGRLDFRR